MKETPWTPGPWLVNPVRAYVEVPNRDVPICAMLWPTELRTEEETFFNARLIAAAPEMAESLHDLLNLLAEMTDGGTEHRVAKARALLAKIGGEA